MQWACVRDATGRDCKWVFVRSSGWIVPGRAGRNINNMSIAASTAMEIFQYYIDDVKEDVQELKTDMQNIQKMLQQIKSTIIYFNCACATLICLNQNKQNGSHNTPLRELGRDQFSLLHFLRPRIRIKYKSLIVLVTMLH
jgi:hypothetical protein